MEVLSQILILVALVGIVVACFWAVVYTQRNLLKILRSGPQVWLVRIGLVLGGGIVGAILASVTWSSSTTQIIMGLPIPVAAWELRDGRWLDFVSPISLVLWGLNLIIWLGLIHLPVAGVIHANYRNNRSEENRNILRS